MRLFLLTIFAVSTIAFVAGLTLPLLELKTFYVFSKTPSLIEMITGLWRAGDLSLAFLVAVFSVILPSCKLAALGLQMSGRAELLGPVAQFLPMLGRWAMLDILLVALLVFAAKTSGLASVTTQPGFWFFFISVLLSAYLGSALKTEQIKKG